MSNMRYASPKKSGKGGKGFFVALGVCLIAVGAAAFLTYQNVSQYFSPEQSASSQQPESKAESTQQAGNTVSGVKETVFEEIALGLENLGIPKDEMIERVIRVCKLLKIEDLIKRDPNALSGGQRQRVAFAAIIAMDSDTLVIDEPTSQLDPEGTADVFAIIQLLKEQGKTVLLVEHKIDLLAEYADEIVVLEKAQVAFHGPAQEVLQNPALLEHGAQIPQVALLGSRLEKRGIGLARIPITQKDAIAAIEERLGGES